MLYSTSCIFLFIFLLLYFHYQSIDASDADSGIIRYANDNWLKPNCKMERLMVDNKPHLFLKAIQNIPANQELRYDYNTDAEWRQARQVRKYISHS